MPTIHQAEQIGATLLASRKLLKLSQAKVAATLGLSQNRLSELESSPETITVAQLLRLLETLGLVMSIEPSPGATAPKGSGAR